MAAVNVHLVRHGKVASHRGNVAVAPEGYVDIEAAARRFAGVVTAEEQVYVLFSPARRSRETAVALHSELRRATGAAAGAEIVPPVAEPAIRNPDIFIAGRRVEMVSTPEALAEQIPEAGLSPELVSRLPFYREFLPHRDRIGYWIAHVDPPGEDAATVARRVMCWSLSLRDQPSTRSRRYICITHSPIMRAVLCRYLLEVDAGEPAWLESVDLVVETPDEATVCYRGACRTTGRR